MVVVCVDHSATDLWEHSAAGILAGFLFVFLKPKSMDSPRAPNIRYNCIIYFNSVQQLCLEFNLYQV